MRDTVSYIAMQLTDASSGCVKFIKPGICFHSTYFVLYIKSICTAVYFVALSRVRISGIHFFALTGPHCTAVERQKLSKYPCSVHLAIVCLLCAEKIGRRQERAYGVWELADTLMMFGSSFDTLPLSYNSHTEQSVVHITYR